MYCIPRRCKISSENSADPSGAPNNTVNAAAIPAMVTQRASSTERLRLRASQPASVPHVVTNGASGPAAPPAEIVRSDIGISDLRVRTPGAVPETWMLSTSSSTSPGLPSISPITTTATPVAPSTTNSAVLLQ